MSGQDYFLFYANIVATTLSSNSGSIKCYLQPHTLLFVKGMLLNGSVMYAETAHFKMSDIDKNALRVIRVKNIQIEHNSPIATYNL
jgi:hypothetical protein